MAAAEAVLQDCLADVCLHRDRWPAIDKNRRVAPRELPPGTLHDQRKQLPSRQQPPSARQIIGWLTDLDQAAPPSRGTLRNPTRVSYPSPLSTTKPSICRQAVV
jgi:hypothetical protein